jgi:hypothetical protein
MALTLDPACRAGTSRVETTVRFAPGQVELTSNARLLPIRCLEPESG